MFIKNRKYKLIELHPNDSWKTEENKIKKLDYLECSSASEISPQFTSGDNLFIFFYFEGFPKMELINET